MIAGVVPTFKILNIASKDKQIGLLLLRNCKRWKGHIGTNLSPFARPTKKK